MQVRFLAEAILSILKNVLWTAIAYVELAVDGNVKPFLE